MKDHKEHLRTLFSRFEKYGVVINVPKCIFGLQEVNFLGYSVSTKGVKPLPGKVKAIQDFNPPKTIKDLRRFLGMINFYRRFVKNAAELQAPLNNLLAGPKMKGSMPIEWNQELLDVFEHCKRSLSDAVMLVHPVPNTELALVTDASSVSIGAVLQQRVGTIWQPLAFYSKKMNTAQQKYSAYDRELLAVYESIKHFKHMVEGRHFSIFTDHKPLVFAFQRKENKGSPRQINQLYYISQYTTDIKHIFGQDNQVADALSRVEAINTPLDMTELADSQKDDSELLNLITGNSSLKLKKVFLPDSKVFVYCDVPHVKPRPFVTAAYR